MPSHGEQQEYLDETCRALSENQPEKTTVDFTSACYNILMPAPCDAVAVRLGEALRENNVVTELSISVGTMTTDGVRGISNFISRSASLRKLHIVYCYYVAEGDAGRAVVDQLLTAAGASGVVADLFISREYQFGAAVFADSMVGLRNSLKKLKLGFSEAVNEESVDIVANALSGLLSLEDLSMRDKSPDSRFAVSIINGLVGHRCLHKLHVYLESDTSNRKMCSGAVRKLLASSTPLEDLNLTYFTGEDGKVSLNVADQGLDEILVGVAGHTTLRVLTVEHDATESDEEAMHVANMLRDNRSVEKLTFTCASMRGVATVLMSLDGAGANHILKELRVWGPYWLNDEEYDEGDWSQLLAEDESYVTVINIIPQLKHLKKIELWKFGRPSERDLMPLLRAFEQNFSLTHVHLDCFEGYDEGGVFTLDPRTTAIDYYGVRNKYRPVLAAASKAKMFLTDFPDLQTKHDDETALSLMLETLRARDDWYAKASSSSTGGSPRNSSNKRRRLDSSL